METSYGDQEDQAFPQSTSAPGVKGAYRFWPEWYPSFQPPLPHLVLPCSQS